MNEEKKQSKGGRVARRASKECAYLAVIVAVVLLSQVCLSVLPSVELVTLLFIAYAFTFGAFRGVLAALAFTILRQLIYGFYPTVFIVYLLYYSGLTALFGFLGARVKKPLRALWWLVLVACACTACFTLFDDIITPLWYGYSKGAMKAYFILSLPFMLPQIVCTAVTVALLFLPLQKVFKMAKRGLKG